MLKLEGTDPEKSYRATLNNDDGDSNENGKKQKELIKKTTFSQHLHHGYETKLHNFTFCGGVNTRQRPSFSINFLNFDTVL